MPREARTARARGHGIFAGARDERARRAMRMDETDDILTAHAAWLARGRVGDGRLKAEGARLSPDLRGADLRHADFEDCDFRRIDLREAHLDGARFRRCLFEGTDLRRATALDARFEECDLRRAALAGLSIGPTGFLRCRFGDVVTQPIGRPEVRGPYVVLAPDTSAHGDASRVGTAAEIDLRWFSPPKDGVERRFEVTDAEGQRAGVRVLHMHLHWYRDTGLRLERQTAEQSFAHFVAAGPPPAFERVLPEEAERRLRRAVAQLSTTWTPPDPAP
jgi:hypothetical protein